MGLGHTMNTVMAAYSSLPKGEDCAQLLDLLTLLGVQNDVSMEFEMTLAVFLFQSVRDFITNCHRLGDLNNRHSFPTVLEAVKPEIKVLPDSVLDEGPVPGR